ncbi:uracil-DNA glycosylase family protein [Rhizobium sp. WYCCWR 11152]|uniref:uracil-DNA glycosylase family protein n=1 Tax=Rhizobium sp. WYCCWR 11152 TaxID=2692316 RepID=UPI001FF01F2A|nr:uracil-DNA glycosylase family protein [Rhizobium sp. WYCCWR 11152]
MPSSTSSSRRAANGGCKPNAGEIRRCAWWLGAELSILQPKLVVTLGATALYALLGPKVKLTPERGHILHPENRLRIRDEAEQRRDFVSDLHKAVEFRSPVKADSQP